jgi:hypothetical protein
MARLIRLSLLSPEIVNAIMENRQLETVTLANLMDPVPLDQKDQRAQWQTSDSSDV